MQCIVWSWYLIIVNDAISYYHNGWNKTNCAEKFRKNKRILMESFNACPTLLNNLWELWFWRTIMLFAPQSQIFIIRTTFILNSKFFRVFCHLLRSEIKQNHNKKLLNFQLSWIKKVRQIHYWLIYSKETQFELI